MQAVFLDGVGQFAILVVTRLSNGKGCDMLTRPTEYRHIVLDDRGVAFIDGTRMKVRLLVLQHLANGWSPEELKWQFPTLSMAQIHAALAYYHDHKDQMDEETREELEQVKLAESQPGRRFTREALEQRLHR